MVISFLKVNLKDHLKVSINMVISLLKVNLKDHALLFTLFVVLSMGNSIRKESSHPHTHPPGNHKAFKRKFFFKHKSQIIQPLK